MPTVDGLNYPGPWEMRLNYNTVQSGLTTLSQLRLSMDVDTPPTPGSPAADYDLKSRSGLFYNFASYVDALVVLLRPLYHTTSNFTNAEFWLYNSGTYNAAFQTSHPVGLAGNSAVATQPYSQAIMTFRSQNGGSARCNLMQSILISNVTDAYPFANAAAQAIADELTHLHSPVIARDGGYLFSSLNLLIGQNEHMFKKVQRP